MPKKKIAGGSVKMRRSAAKETSRRKLRLGLIQIKRAKREKQGDMCGGWREETGRRIEKREKI
ncbi:hypothetical protein ACIPEN_19970 [Herbaspirillum chlorophenolicum]|uniref:Uncharacterized protein n=1 Tax=Herbaspirillum chlorophenolicum TaxID=211589 RepID=A0ABW8F492_9BURK